MTDPLHFARESLVFHVLEPVIERGGAAIGLRYQIDGQIDGHPDGTDGITPLTFVERIELPGDDVAAADRPAFDRVVRLLALAAGLSYYKTCIPATMRVGFGLTAQEREFLRATIEGGLGEFAYRNDVPAALRPTILAEELPAYAAVAEPSGEPTSALVAVGGGKDSIVTLESLRALDLDLTLFSVNDYAPIRATAEHAGLDLVVATRRLDPLLFELNEQGALNGHVPVTAVNSLIGCLSALRLGLDAVVFSNEASASVGNLAWQGIDVNHQWSKGIGFEGLLRQALSGVPVTYLSFLRPLTELAIMRRFATLTSYHPVFTSCNRAFHLDAEKRRAWCGDCPKCRFVFLCLGPFVSRESLTAIFGGRDLLADERQWEGFLDLLNADGRLKPFECVGEPDECRVAASLLAEHPDWRSHAFFALPVVQQNLVAVGDRESAFGFEDAHFLTPALEKAAREVL